MFGTYFLLSNLLIGLIIGPILIISIITIMLSFMFNPIAKIVSYFLNILRV